MSCNRLINRSFLLDNDLFFKEGIIHEDDRDSLACVMAVTATIGIIEKHVKLGDLASLQFDFVAIGLYDNNFKTLVNAIRNAEIMCGGMRRQGHSFEHHKCQVNSIAN